ncbi:MAG: IS3 family transposase, partial [Pseudomonas gingeri]
GNTALLAQALSTALRNWGACKRRSPILRPVPQIENVLRDNKQLHARLAILGRHNLGAFGLNPQRFRAFDPNASFKDAGAFDKELLSLLNTLAGLLFFNNTSVTYPMKALLLITGLMPALDSQGMRLSEKVVQRLMKQECLVVAKPKRRRYGSYLGEISPAPENLVNRDFTAIAPNEKWLTDISEFQIPAGKVYLSPMIDCFDGKVISWSIGTRPDSELVNTMLDAAVETVACTDKRPVVHSDRGAHYRWPGWLSRIADAKLIRSMSRKGCSPDNAACEGFFGRLKTELFYPRNWQSTSIEQFIQALDSYIRWYNEKRIKISLGALSPIEYRESLGLAA